MIWRQAPRKACFARGLRFYSPAAVMAPLPAAWRSPSRRVWRRKRRGGARLHSLFRVSRVYPCASIALTQARLEMLSRQPIKSCTGTIESKKSSASTIGAKWPSYTSAVRTDLPSCLPRRSTFCSTSCSTSRPISRCRFLRQAAYLLHMSGTDEKPSGRS